MLARVVLLGLALAAPASLIPPPPGAQLVSRSLVDEVRAFPELASTRAAEKIDGVERVFQTDRAFGDVVVYFDDLFKTTGYRTRARVETASTTSWTVARPDGTIAYAIVRNTRPTTFELAEVQPK